MLPFLKDKKVAGLIISKRTPDGSNEIQDQDAEAGLQACSDEIIRAIESKDGQALASALRSAFQILESEPHSENNGDNE